jgi:hypothetical protein
LGAGYEPYEELLKDVYCPTHLKVNLRLIWEAEEDGPYGVIREVIESLADPDEDEQLNGGTNRGSSPGDVLYDTLYRYLVLFGIPTEFCDVGYDMPWRHNRVWNCLMECLRGEITPDRGGRGGRPRRTGRAGDGGGLDTCVAEYIRDMEVWNFTSGSHSVMRR